MGYRNGMPFAFWCHKVLPLVYDDSLSYYEFLCKLAKILQEVMEHDVEQDETIQKCVDDIQTLSEDIHSINLRIEDIIEHDNQQDENLQELEENLVNFQHDINEQIGDIEERIRGVILDLETIKGNLYNEYDESTNYSVGDLVGYEGELYVCTASTTGEFNPNDWSNTNLSAQIEGLRDNYTALVTEIWEVIAPEFQNYEGATFLIPKGTVVRYESMLYVANTDITVDHVIDVPPMNTDFNGTRVSWELLSLTNQIVGMGHNLASEYDRDLTYNIGDYCMHNNVLYKCNSSNVTGTWDSTKWTRVIVTNEMGQGGGGTGNVTIPDFSTSAGSYTVFDAVMYNDALYIARHNINPALGWNANDWLQVDFNDWCKFTWAFMSEKQPPFFSGNASFYDNQTGSSEDIKKGQIFLVDWRDINSGVTEFTPFFVVANHDIPAFTGGLTISDVTPICTEDVINIFNMKTTAYEKITYDDTRVYKVGEVVQAAGSTRELEVPKIYRCTVDGATGTFNYSDWEETSLLEEISRIKETLIGLNLYNGNLVDRFSTNVTEVI